ncbi:MAG: hypothetical protein MUF72_04615 [Elainella sp. Prado103]|jgi:hypothetical protein|nr:hypothetical protein [Elainella sp. Prado103]
MFLTNHFSLPQTADQALFHISDRALAAELDPYALDALKETEAHYGDSESAIQERKRSVRGEGRSGSILRISRDLDQRNLDDITRLLLSRQAIYTALFAQAIQEYPITGEIREGDEKGLAEFILMYAKDYPRRYLLAKILDKVTTYKGIQITDSKQWETLDDLVLSHGINVRSGQVLQSVTHIFETMNRQRDIPYYVDLYISSDGSNGRAARHAFPRNSFTSMVRKAMIDYLLKLDIAIKNDPPAYAFDRGEYDKYFVIAYNEARRLSAAGNDPLSAVRNPGSEIAWDFSVDMFESPDGRGVIPDNIRAAGALDYIYYVGEMMRVFDIANALVLRWARGALDVPEGKTADALYRFHKLREERSTTEERGMLYKRVLNKGDAKLLSNMVVNESFPMYWHNLMTEVAEYIRKSEGTATDGRVSRTPIYQATRDLQHNLTEHMTGMAHRQVHEDYAHLKDALGIIAGEEVVGSLGGRRKTIWSVIEQVAKEDLGVAVPTASLRTLAVEGNRIFQWLAEFTPGAVSDETFQKFLNAAEAWVIARAGLSDDEGPSHNGSSKRSKSNDDKEDDDFEDW